MFVTMRGDKSGFKLHQKCLLVSFFQKVIYKSMRCGEYRHQSVWDHVKVWGLGERDKETKLLFVALVEAWPGADTCLNDPP